MERVALIQNKWSPLSPFATSECIYFDQVADDGNCDYV